MALDDALIAEIQAADVVVLGVPMYNFGVPAQLKNWIDAISRAGVTFRYTEQGPEGLLKGKTVYVALTRGGKYRNTPADTQVPYLKTVFTFLGLTDVHFVYAEGLSMGFDAEQHGDRFRVRADRGSGGGVTRTGPGSDSRARPQDSGLNFKEKQDQPDRRTPESVRSPLPPRKISRAEGPIVSATCLARDDAGQCRVLGAQCSRSGGVKDCRSQFGHDLPFGPGAKKHLMISSDYLRTPCATCFPHQ